jgi:hypothetical protein
MRDDLVAEDVVLFASSQSPRGPVFLLKSLLIPPRKVQKLAVLCGCETMGSRS